MYEPQFTTIIKTSKFLFTIIFCSFTLLMSCNNEDPMLNTDDSIQQPRANELISDSICINDENGDIINPVANPTSKGTETDITPFSSDNVITVVGYTAKTYMKSEVTVFSKQPVDNRLSPYVYYIQDYYTYIYRVTIPHDATLIIPSNFDETWATGMQPDNQSLIGYNKYLISQSTNGDVYELRTIIREISYNSSGQYLGFTSYLPFRVGNPATDLIFKYSILEIEW